MFKISNVGAIPGGESFLLTFRDKTVLVDNGFKFCAEETIDNIETQLKGRKLDYILLTHSHYDHVSATYDITLKWPEAKVVASEHTHKVFLKPSALKLINEMNDKAAEEFGYKKGHKVDNLTVDIVVRDGDVIELGDTSLLVIEAPGHTRCSIAFYSEEENLLIANETLGNPGDNFDYVVPCNLVGYQMTLDSIDKLSSYNADKILIPHYGMVYGERCRRFLQLSKESIIKTNNMIIHEYENGSDLEGIIEMIKGIYYTDTLADYHPEVAFMPNTRHMVLMTLRECLGVDLKS